MSRRLSYLDELMNNDVEEDECFDWEGNEKPKAAKPCVLPKENVEPVVESVVKSHEKIEKVEESQPNYMNFDFYKVEPKKKESEEKIEPQNEIAHCGKTRKDIARWNKRTQTMDDNDWKAVRNEFDTSCRKLDYNNKKKTILKDSKKSIQWENLDVKKIRSMVEDFGEKIIQPPWYVCVVCRRQFDTEEMLRLHCEKSVLHYVNTNILTSIDYEMTGRTLKVGEAPQHTTHQQYPTEIPNIENNVGFQLLKQMGFDQTQEYNTEQQNVELKQTRAGIGAATNVHHK
ncbi:hypothetical protein EIN_057590 [Entamoeba invadens IP1]|uniref:hypothetical protein n=1 Tax=Entamoeba invadens IP1 TaxID=370355 RepID=UPI0002C3FB32|nr:hypothetical protein EIN_057590 [Entamoeba invadens IP1]ELP93354.1 hypothetical protein EIN_057590 [Entamoeba invadens IP1]|eukprot:XP_004260125.1 hypothetical protein EIN_057590 [Entamoeba invadens IP1]